MEIRKAIITAAGKHQRTLPLQTLVDRDGQPKTALQILAEEVVQAGVEELAVVIAPGDQPAFASAAGPLARRIRFIEQPAPLGYGHAVACARPFTGDQAFLLLVCDHLYVHSGEHRCAKQLVACAQAGNCSVSAVQATHESKLPYYGAVGGHLVTGQRGLYQITEVLEKPAPTEAEQRLIVPGLRAGYYLCFFGMHVLTPAVMELLAEAVTAAGAQGGVHLTGSLSRLAARERYLACELQGRRYDIGARYGLLNAQLALALAGGDRDEVLTNLVDLLANRR